MRVGITGHQRLSDATKWPWVQEQIDAILSGVSRPLIGLTSLAAGADQIFARSVLQHSGILRVIVPFLGYEEKFADEEAQREYHRLIGLADKVETLKLLVSEREAYFRAGKPVVHTSELLVAVWDGRPAAGLGGTGDTVAYAVGLCLPVIHINPMQSEVTYLNTSQND